MSLEFTLVRRAISLAVIDGPDAGDNPDILKAQGSVLFEPVIKKGDSIQVQTRGGSETYALAPIECPINDGIISHRGQDGVKLPAGGEAANPSLIRWKATFSRMQAGGKSFTLAPVIFDAVPGGEIDLTMVAPVAGAPEGVVRGPRGTSLESIIVDGSELVFTAVDDAGSFEIARIPLDEMVRAEAEAAADGVRDELAVDVAASQSARDAAEGHASRAATSETNAAASESAAKQSETNAGDYAAVATTAATEAVDAMETASDAVSRIDALEAMAGLAPGSPVDGQTANLVAQPETMTRKLLNRYFAAAEVVGQPNYVALMASRSNYSTMTVTKTSSSGALEVKCANTDGTQSVAYTVTNPNRYQYIGSVSASSTERGDREIVFNDLQTTGAYSGTSTTPYTTEVGATWQVEVTISDASTVDMRHFVDSRGGVWRVSVVELPTLTTDVSTFNPSVWVYLTTLFTIPTPGTYTIRGEFIGEDSANPPTSGSARGWLGPILGSAEHILTVPYASEETATVELSPVSNKDFAFRMKPAGTDANSEFIPYHGTASEVFASPTQYYSAGELLDIDALSVGEPVPVESFEIVQHIYGRNSTAPDPTQNIAEFWTTQKIAPDGTYYASGRWKALVDIEMHSSSYPMMLMGRLPLFDEVISSVGTSHAISGENTPRNIWLTQERDLPEGYAMLSSTSDYVAAVQVDSRRETLRAGAPDKPGSMAFIELRTGGIMAKVYQLIYSTGVIVPAGTIQRFGGSYWYGAIPGMHSVLSLS